MPEYDEALDARLRAAANRPEIQDLRAMSDDDLKRVIRKDEVATVTKAVDLLVKDTP